METFNTANGQAGALLQYQRRGEHRHRLRCALFQHPGFGNTAIGGRALHLSTGVYNTAVGNFSLDSNTTGTYNTAIGANAGRELFKSLNNATAIGANAIVDASNKIRLGDSAVTVIEGQVAYTFTSDKTKKENFQPVNARDILRKLATLDVTSWNYIGHDANAFRHYGPMAQDFFAAFGNDGTGTVGTPTAINSGDQAGILMLAVQALEAENRRLQQDLQDLRSAVDDLKGGADHGRCQPLGGMPEQEGGPFQGRRVSRPEGLHYCCGPGLEPPTTGRVSGLDAKDAALRRVDRQIQQAVGALSHVADSQRSWE